MWGKVHRYIPAMAGAILVCLVVFLGLMRDSSLIVATLNFQQMGTAKFWFPGHHAVESQGVNWQTIIFIAGMMLMVEGLAKVGFFRWMCLYVARLVKFKTMPILIAFTIMAGFLSMFIDSITVMLFLASVTIEMARLLKFDPVPLIIAEIFASNTGGSASMSGDPPNIIIGTALGFTFMDFIKNAGVIAWTSMIATLIFFYFTTRKALTRKVSPDPDDSNDANNGKPVYPSPGEAIKSPLFFGIHVFIFLLTVILLVTHAQSGLSVAIIGVIAAVLTLFAVGKEGLHLLSKLDWKTLLFFIGLFVTVGGLEHTGLLAMLANFIGDVSQGSTFLVLTIIIWMSAILSALVDNIPFAATMVPVISNLAITSGIPLGSLAYTLALGTDIGGNGTPIGASANVVGTAIAEREGHPISWGRFCKYGIPASVMVITICWLMCIVKFA
ncbi:MAG: anion permease [Dehalococcoidales bacterium]|nr:anion permease [Dehalococcoidales bacterium]